MNKHKVKFIKIFKMKARRSIVISFVIFVVLIFLFYTFKFAKHYPANNDLEFQKGFFGVTFSTKFCDELGLDWKKTYLAILDDLKVKEIRLPIYWDEIEKADGVYDFSDYDFMISEGSKRGVKFIANIGWRLPRWPECHAPKWVEKRSLTVTQDRTIVMIGEVVNHYKNNKAIIAWQVENEPFLDAFGVCPPSNAGFFERELEVVRNKDSRPIVVSATGELSWWRKEALYGDIFGSTIYRVVWGNWSGYVR
ncbi:MAG: cellulase family glycosylhydrolase, partial [Candidatus Paceibacterota bacterium]